MIPLGKEPDEFYEHTRVYEKCYFCKDNTDLWHELTNTPVCSDCSKSHEESDIKKPIFDHMPKNWKPKQ